MTTAADPAVDQPDHPRTRSMESWRGRKAVLASRGEVDGPRVAECDAALAWWRIRTRLVKDMDITPERAESLLDLIVPPSDAPHDGLPTPDSPASVAQRQPESPSDAESNGHSDSPAETDAAAVSS